LDNMKDKDIVINMLPESPESYWLDVSFFGRRELSDEDRAVEEEFQPKADGTSPNSKVEDDSES
jgi:hypothetical protein